MIHYTFYQKNPASHYIYIDLLISDVKVDKLRLQLPSWRPGRYEPGNFAKNIKKFECFDEENKPLQFRKLSKDLWEVDSAGTSNITVRYSYFGAELNAGSCYADNTQVYINPVHCCFVVEGRTSEQHRIKLDLPAAYEVVTSMHKEKGELVAADYEELVDSPFIASEKIQSDHYEVNGMKFYLHFNGECAPDFAGMKKEFEQFTKTQIAFWEDFPYDEYHFLFQILPSKFYHGVEHKKSTVIAIGPGYELNSGSTYEEILGVSSHELFHVWNVKTIRPAEMLPYDYSRENYSRSGYVYEGFTTYYGDKLLLGSGVFNLSQYFNTLEERLQRHFHNYGRYNLSVADSSWDTWLDGYVPGAPYRKTSIYDEGCLIAFMLDVKILFATNGKKSLRDVCRMMYRRFGKGGKGYIEEDIPKLVNEIAGTDLTKFFETYVYGSNEYDTGLLECFGYLGIELLRQSSKLVSENLFGFKTVETSTGSRISLVAPYSPAWKAGLFAGDEIIAVNNMVIRNNLNSWLDYFKDRGQLSLIVNSGEKLRTIHLDKDKKGQTYFFSPKLKMNEALDDERKAAFENWKKS